MVRVAAGQGFWGDDLDAPRRQVEGGPIDYLMLDYLAEVTMSILQKQKERDASRGYARDFVGAVESVLPAVAERGVKVVANAGGVNPQACAAAVKVMAEERGYRLKIGVVTGDDCKSAVLYVRGLIRGITLGEPDLPVHSEAGSHLGDLLLGVALLGLSGSCSVWSRTLPKRARRPLSAIELSSVCITSRMIERHRELAKDRTDA